MTSGGRINARELHEQINSCSCLTLILACVIYWQAREISRAVRRCKSEDGKIDTALLVRQLPRLSNVATEARDARPHLQLGPASPRCLKLSRSPG